MRLINTTTLESEEFLEPPVQTWGRRYQDGSGYAILSHRWEAEEISFE